MRDPRKRRREGRESREAGEGERSKRARPGEEEPEPPGPTPEPPVSVKQEPREVRGVAGRVPKQSALLSLRCCSMSCCNWASLIDYCLFALNEDCELCTEAFMRKAC